jgi:hypothetical protein
MTTYKQEPTQGTGSRLLGLGAGLAGSIAQGGGTMGGFFGFKDGGIARLRR